jgi:hypothetical protein
MKTQIKLLEVADEKKMKEFIERAFLTRVGLAKDNGCRACSDKCPIYEECDGCTDSIGSNPVDGIGIIEIMAPRVYFRGSISDAYFGYRQITDFL